MFEFVDTLDRKRAIKSAVDCWFSFVAARHQRINDTAYCELSISYISTVANTSIGSAHNAWHLIKSNIDWKRVKLDEAEAIGFRIRRLTRGMRHGQHLIFSLQTIEKIIETEQHLKRLGRAFDFESEFDWVALEIQGRMALCPWHEDTIPSMIVNFDSTESALGVCLVCMNNGNYLKAQLRKKGDKWFAKKCGQDQDAAREPKYKFDNRESERNQIICDYPIWTWAPEMLGRYVLGRLTPKYMRRHQSRRTLVDILKWSETKSKEDSAVEEALEAEVKANQYPDQHFRFFLPDLLVSTTAMTPSYWRKLKSGRNIPDSYESKTRRWVLFDIDKINSSSSIRSISDEFVRCIGNIVSTFERLDGSWALVQTSPSGLQLWLKLKGPVNAAEFSRCVFTHEWLLEIGRMIESFLTELGADCIIDETAWALNRFGRRPGWRMLKNKSVFRSRLVSYYEELNA